METIAISKFKATCLSLLERVKNTKEPILVTKKGVPIAQVIPAQETDKERSWYACMQDSLEIRGDIVSPVGEEDWEVLK